MSELDCQQVGAQIDEYVSGCCSWVELGERLSPAEQEHLCQCSNCRNRAVELLEIERQLGSLRLEPLPGLDLTAGVMARLRNLEQPQRFPLLAWVPLMLVLACLLPDPDWLPAWLGWSFALPDLSPGWHLPDLPLSLSPNASDSVLLVASLALLVTTLKWRQPSRA